MGERQVRPSHNGSKSKLDDLTKFSVPCDEARSKMKEQKYALQNRPVCMESQQSECESEIHHRHGIGLLTQSMCKDPDARINIESGMNLVHIASGAVVGHTRTSRSAILLSLRGFLAVSATRTESSWHP